MLHYKEMSSLDEDAKDLIISTLLMTSKKQLEKSPTLLLIMINTPIGEWKPTISIIAFTSLIVNLSEYRINPSSENLFKDCLTATFWASKPELEEEFQKDKTLQNSLVGFLGQVISVEDNETLRMFFSNLSAAIKAI